MCGIYGLAAGTGNKIAPADLEAMGSVLRHRGPDDDASMMLGSVALGFRRLSIIDVAGGRQPMCNEDGSIWIVFNGEIYNHLELRRELQQHGHRYTTHSDTESIVHLYEEYGERCVERLRGMFAFAILDRKKNLLFCARDRLGIKPFYYRITEDEFAFASEIKALFQAQSYRPKLNRRVLPEFFAFGYVSSEETLFDGVQKLMPGHYLVLDLNQTGSKPRIHQYWDLDSTPSDADLGEREYVEQFRTRFSETVRSHLMSDVPLGVFLSGGLDSSAIAATVATLRQEPIETFSVGYAEERYSELPYARRVAEHIGAHYNEVRLGPDDFFNALPQLTWQEDEPIVWPSSVALSFVSRLAQEKVKVVLTGEGGDELFAGYLKYRVTLWNRRYGRAYRKVVPGAVQQLIRDALSSGCLPDSLQRKLRHTFLYCPDRFEQIYFDNFFCAFSEAEQARMFTREVLEEHRGSSAYQNSLRFFRDGSSNRDLLSRLLYLDTKTYLVELLMKQDQMSMAASVESRVPFLDHELVEWVARVPEHYKVRGFSGKYLLRKAMADRLPAEIINRHKKGFPTPIRPWLRNQLFGKVSSVLSDGRLADRQFIRAEYIESMLERHRRGDAAATEGCWRLLTFEMWNRIFFDGERSQIESQTDRVKRAALCA